MTSSNKSKAVYPLEIFLKVNNLLHSCSFSTLKNKQYLPGVPLTSIISASCWCSINVNNLSFQTVLCDLSFQYYETGTKGLIPMYFMSERRKDKNGEESGP